MLLNASSSTSEPYGSLPDPEASGIFACSHRLNQQLNLLSAPKNVARGVSSIIQDTTFRQAASVALPPRIPTAPRDPMQHTDNVVAVPEPYLELADQKSHATSPCAICFDLDIEKNSLPGQRAGRGWKLCEVSELKDSANSCRGCWLLATGLARASGSAQPAPHDKIHIVFQVGMPLRIESSTMDLEFFVQTRTTPRPCLGQGHTVPTDLTAEAVAVLAKRWLETCREEHPECVAFVIRHLHRPRRLIHLSAGPAGNGVRLVETSAADDPYIALSYCWGTHGNATTTRATIRDRMSGIDYASLPKTIRDAVDIARCLGVHHLWVDSLCIIQDDTDNLDWRSESAKMDSIYGGAVLTLSATRSSSVDMGFLSPRARRPVEQDSDTLTIPWATSDGATATIFVRRRLPHDAILPEDTNNTERYPLLKRGWTFQERLLAHRTLHFLPQEVVWECRCEYWCECRGAQADQVWKTGEVRGSLFSQALASPHPRSLNLGFVWRSMVRQYSGRILTRADDRLPALSGVARRFQELDPLLGRYLAGLWEKDLLRHLLWQVDHDQVKLRGGEKQQQKQGEQETTGAHEHVPEPHTANTALKQKSIATMATKSPLTGSFCDKSPDFPKPLRPSWSWVSTEWPILWPFASVGSVTYQTPDLEVKHLDIKLSSCIVEHDTVNPYGAVYSGVLTLRTVVTTAMLQEPRGNNTWYISPRPSGSLFMDDAIFIPDGTYEELHLSARDTIHCALISVFSEDGHSVTPVYLALRQLEPDTSGVCMYQSGRYRSLRRNDDRPPEYKCGDNLRDVYTPSSPEPRHPISIKYYRVGLVIRTGDNFESLFFSMEPREISII